MGEDGSDNSINVPNVTDPPPNSRNKARFYVAYTLSQPKISNHIFEKSFSLACKMQGDSFNTHLYKVEVSDNPQTSQVANPEDIQGTLGGGRVSSMLGLLP